MNLQEQLCDWDNLALAYKNASRGKRGQQATAQFEFLLGDNLIELQNELSDKSFQLGKYHSFHIHEPKKRLISAAPFRDRVVHHALCNITTAFFEKQFIPTSYANRARLNLEQAVDAIDVYQSITLETADINLKDAVRLAGKHNIYAYDAYILQCAIEHELPLISLDKNLIGVQGRKAFK